MKQVKTIIFRLGAIGFGGKKNAEKFDEAVNNAIKEIDGEVIDIKYSFSQISATAMIVYEKRRD